MPHHPKTSGNPIGTTENGGAKVGQNGIFGAKRGEITMDGMRVYERLNDLTDEEKAARKREQNRKAALRYREEHKEEINQRRRERYAAKKKKEI
jgi:hypothetical protein